MWGSSQVFQSDEAGTIREWVAVLDKESPAFQQATECCLQMLKDLRATEHELTQQLIQLKTEFSVYKHSIEDRLEGMRNLQVSAKRNKDELMRELEISKEAIKVLLAEMKELRASTERDKEELTRELKISKEAIKTLLEEMNELRVSGQNVARDLENSKEAKKTLLEEIGNLRASPVKECDEIDSANRRPLFKKLKGIFGSSKSKRLKKKRHLHQEAAPFQKQEPRANKEGRYSVTYGDSLEETRTDSGQWPQHSNSVSQSSLASSGMLLAGPSRGNYTDSGQESHKMTDSQHSLKSDGVQQRSFASSRKRAVGPSHGNYTDSGQESNKMADSQHSLESDGVQQRSFASPGMVLADSPLGNCVYRSAEYKAMSGSQQSFYSDGAQQRSSVYSRNISSYGSTNSIGCFIHQIHHEIDVPLVHTGSRRELYRRGSRDSWSILPYELTDTIKLRDVKSFAFLDCFTK